MKLRVRQAIYVILAVAAFALLIIVITNSQSPESLMNPPEAAGDYKNIQNVIEKSLGDGIILKAPNEGEYTTSITYLDLNTDGENDAVAFYRIKNDDTSAIYMSVLIKSDSKWMASEPIKGKGNDVLEFSFGDLNYDSVPEIVVGWNMFDSKDNNTLSVYEVSNKSGETQVKTCDSVIYTKMYVADVCAEGRNEILLIKNTFNDETSPATATVYEFVDSKLKVINTAQLVAEVSDYRQLQLQSVSGTNVFYLDGVIEAENMITEIIYWNKDAAALESPTYAEQAQEVVSYREETVPSSDINNDGIIEIPFAAGETDSRFVELTDWKQFTFKDYISIASGICSDELVFVYPQQWGNAVAVSHKGKVWSFYDTRSGESVKLFDLVVSDISEWQTLSKQYDKLTIYYGTIYGVKLTSSDSDLSLSKNEIRDCIINIR